MVYQIYPRSFQDSTGDGVGDIPGIIQRLDYLKYLGVDVIWLSPVYTSPNVDNGYDISDYQAILPQFGTMDDFDRLLEKAHLCGIRIVMDLVVNHTSDQHAWFMESRSSQDNPKRDWYLWRDGYEGGAPNALTSVFSGPAWQWDQTTGQYYLHMFSREQPDVNWGNELLRQAVYDMMKWWLDKGIDGFRMDVISMISKPAAALASDGGPGASVVNGPHVHEYLKQMNQQVLSHYDIMTVGETVGVTVDEAKKYAGYGSDELNMVFQFELMEVDSDEATGKWTTRGFDLVRMKEVLSRWQTGLDGVAWNCLFWSNHDQPRVVSRFGDTSTEIFWKKSATMLATCLHMMQGTPFIYQGEELGMTNYPFQTLDDCQDLETHNAYQELVVEKKVFSHEEMMAAICTSTRDNARTPMQWDASPGAGFTTGKPWLAVNPNCSRINAQAQCGDEGSVFHYYRRLIGLRRRHPIIVYGSYELLLPQDDRVYVYRRSMDGAGLVVMCNFTAQTITDLDLGSLVDAQDHLLVGNYSTEEMRTGVLAPYEARVYLSQGRGGPDAN